MKTQYFGSLAKFAAKAVVTLTILGAAAASTAGILVINGDTTGDSTWTRTTSGTPPNALSGVGTAVHYEVTQFHVSANGVYDLSNVSVYDNYLHLYSTAFNSTSQFSNVVAADDDGGTSLNASLSLNLLAGVEYFAVSSGFENTDFGAFTLTISGVGDIASGGVSNNVPEPTSLALMGLALIGLTAASRRKTL